MGLVSAETFSPEGIPLIEFEECLNERKWWCFLLSSIFTFILGLLSVVVVRLAQNFLCQQVKYSELINRGSSYARSFKLICGASCLAGQRMAANNGKWPVKLLCQL